MLEPALATALPGWFDSLLQAKSALAPMKDTMNKRLNTVRAVHPRGFLLSSSATPYQQLSEPQSW